MTGSGALAELITGKHGGEASVARDPQGKFAAPSVPYWVLIISTGNFNAGTPYPSPWSFTVARMRWGSGPRFCKWKTPSSEKYSITIDLSCTTCGGPVQNGLRSTAPWLNAQCRNGT